MTTSKPFKIVLFTKENCKPCSHTKDDLRDVLNLHPEYEYIITPLQKENHPALVAAYELNLYPTAIIFDDEMQEITRRMGYRNLTRGWFEAALFSIHKRRTKENV